MALSSQLASIRHQLEEQATPRALIGLGILVFILAYLGLTALGDEVVRLRSDVEDLQRNQRLERSLLTDQSWREQAENLQTQLQDRQSRFWSGATPGIVSAQLQGAVETAARNASLRQIRVNVESSPIALGESAVLFEISLISRDTDGQFLSLFQELSRAEHDLVISRFSWRRQNGALELRLQAPAIIIATPEGQS